MTANCEPGDAEVEIVAEQLRRGDSANREPATGVEQSAVGSANRVVELPDSTVEPGGPPVRVDPDMVNSAAAEQMRPLGPTDR